MARRLLTAIARPSLAVGALLCFSLVVARAQTAQEILEKVRKNYEMLHDVQIKFTQRIAFAVSHMEQHTAGTLEFKKDHKYRIELEDQTIVTDGETVWSYSASSNQVLIDRFTLDEHALSPERILTGAPRDFSATLIGRDQGNAHPAFILKLQPKAEQGTVKSLKLWIDEDQWLIRRVEIVDFNATETTYTVSDIRLDTGLDDSRFSYRIPEGASVVDLR